jgi:deoxyribose-phosphate aldolase
VTTDRARAQFDPSIAALIDHTVLKAEATYADVAKLCEEARRYAFASVCVNGSRVQQAAAALRESRVKVCTVIGFPLGAMAGRAKVAEAGIALLDGATELDMVINIGLLKDGEDAAVRADIAALASTAHKGGAIVKVIIETALLTDDEKRRACRLAAEAGADFVKTSTGFASAGATAADVALMREAVGPGLGVKASGGIRTLADLRAMVAAGATRIGASASVKILQESIG